MKQKLAARGWMIVVAGMALAGGLRMARGPWIETQFWALLPEIKQSLLLQTALDRLFMSQQRKAFWAVGHRDPDIARQSYDQALTTIRNSPIVSLSPFPDPEELQKVFLDVYFPLRYQMLSSADVKILNMEKPAGHFVRRLKSFLVSPMAGWGARIVTQDPMLLFFQLASEWKESMPENKAESSMARFWEKGGLRIESEGKTYFMLAAEVAGEPFSAPIQERLTALDQELSRAISSRYPEAEVVGGGFWRFAARERMSIQKELGLLGSLSTAAVFLLFWALFGSFRPLAMALVCLAVGTGMALTACLLVFGRIHAVALLFGTSLIGVGVDYSFHYFVHARTIHDFSLAHVAPGLLLGALTSVLGFLALAFVPLPVLHQMAIFSSVGLAASLLTVFCWFPLFKYPGGGHLTYFMSATFKALMAVAGWMTRFPRAFRLGGGLFLVLAVVGLFRLRAQDNPAQFQNPAADLLEAETKLRMFQNVPAAPKMAVVWGKDPEQLLERQESLHSLLQEKKKAGILKSFQSLAPFLPSRNRQIKEGALLREKFLPQADEFTAALAKMGFNPSVGRDLIKNIKQPISPAFSWQNWMANPAMKFLSAMWLGPVEDGWASIFLLQGVDSNSRLGEILSREAGVQFLDPFGAYEKILMLSRTRSTAWGIAAYILIFCVLIFRYGWPLGGLLILPCLLSSLATLAVLGWLGLSFHLIHSLGLLLVLSLGVDYAIFFGEAVRKREPLDAAAMAVSLSALTTILSFALFLFCHSPVLRALGLTVSLGISLVFLGTVVICGLYMNRFEQAAYA